MGQDIAERPATMPGAQTTRRRPGMKSWPECGCVNRCARSVCVHGGGREIAKEAASFSVVGRKSSPERLTYLLDRIMMFPHISHACAMAGTTYSTLRYWLLRSEKGTPNDGFTLDYDGETKRFHEHFEDARETSVQMVEDEYMMRALMGYMETLTDKGRIQYQYDDVLLALGYTGVEAYLRDEHGKPIPEQIAHQDPDVQLQVLKAWRREKYGAHQNIDVTHRGGVLVVGVRAKDSAEIEAREKAHLTEAVDVEFREVEPADNE